MLSQLAAEIVENKQRIETEMARACQHFMMPSAATEVIAVSKRQPPERIDAALEAGIRLFGENLVDEAEKRWAHRRQYFPDLKLHLIGSLQSNKTARAVALFDCIQTVDRSKIARALAREMEKQKRPLPIMVQVNTGAEPQKGGALAEDLPSLLAECKELGLSVTGLMAIPPAQDEPALHFALLKKLAQDHGIDRLSMGMSADYGVAAAMGADYVRVGTALFGQRLDRKTPQ